MRRQPTALIGIGLWVLYIAIILVVQGTSGIPYTDVGDSAANMWRGAILSLILGAAVMAAATRWLGWWDAALRDTRRSGAGWTLVAPGIYLVMAIGVLASVGWSELTPAFLGAAIALGVFVGFAEEIVCRGLLLVGLRGSVREVWVWLLTCVFFGLMHGLNILLGAAAGETALQVGFAALQGSAFYVLRRVTGSLVWAMMLHGFWDAALFMNVQTDGGTPITSLLNVIAGPVALVAGYVVARRTDAGAREPYAVVPGDAVRPLP